MRKLFSSVLVCLLLALYSVLFNSCEKEYSYEGGFLNGSATGTAVYTLTGAGGNCTGTVISGQYYKDIPLTTANAIQLEVEVDSVGTYAITTNSSDGFSFSTSGTFTTTGIQKITLTGSGTPATAGSFTFTPPVGLGCNFIIEVTQAPPAIGEFTFMGAPDKCLDPKITGNYTSGATLTNANTVIIEVNVSAIGAYSITTDTLDGITFSSSGSFTTTGDQTVSLIGSGTPELARYLPFSVISPGTQRCSFNVTVVDPEPLATYVLESGAIGTTNVCIYTVQGAVTHNVALDGSNTVTIRVTVTVPGNFTIATNSINGMTFSYSGTFTTMGAQNVILKGDGVPATSGISSFVPNIVGPHPIGGESCAFDITVL